MEVTLLGTGDTTGTPTVGCDCDTCERARSIGVERTRFSVHVRSASGQSLLVDFSPDFRSQFLREDLEPPDAAVVTHIHFDHLDGLGNVYRLADDLPVYAADETDPATGESVARTVRERYDYLDAVSVEPTAPFEPVRAAGLAVTLVPVDHPPFLCYGLLVEDPETGGRLALSGDTSYDVPDRSLAALSGADLLLADGIVPAENCEYHPLGGRHHDDAGVPRTFGDKHMTVEGARQLGDRLDAERTRLVHLSHYIPADRAFEDDMAVDGERFHL
ncbi:Metal-dependent hydrolase of the beta-lactamase superfamily [Halapricum desulfuricans]|uniref:Metal-dependent hydrolase of the beta-lactamase superfamily n=1 Tax=Halapricum desulfuricans TaxID=2841257 RepID=A0A897NLD8_9EURY|nr:MBL fold metallo-hydrolase [Halapricum desulfuricans]QSG11689.1 Metal-dependent hydrolase of the beta-lactamase superfamily [Halapricum desulfuricans]